MGSAIKRLPESLRNSMRSGVVLYDMARVVEELVFNSLDAGAKKVSVYVGVGTCYIKVVDDGCGVDRDGLVLLGERYVTSRRHNVGVDDRSFGFHGEALASISDVSLLEILTKASGRPNGYRKVVKGSKCVYLGISDRKDVGTTVSVRDLFYNQPVRRKSMQSSPKKVLQSIKKCALRIALVHSWVSFKLVDIESEDELLCTRPSSMLSLLTKGFGIDDSSSLYELNVSDGLFKLSGYLTGPSNSFSIKAFQYVYINSRFVCKGPVHKLLNHLASTFEYMDPWKEYSASEKGKRSRVQAYPAYIINIDCPSSLYDLNLEPSKTHAEFKDWVPILTFIEKAVHQLWKKSIVNADEFSKDENERKGDDISYTEDEFAIKNCELPKEQWSHHLTSSPLEMLTDEVEYTFNMQNTKVPFQEFCFDDFEYKEQPADTQFVCQEDYSRQSWDDSLSKRSSIVTDKNDSHWSAADYNFLLPDDCTMGDRYIGKETSSINLGDCALSSEWQIDSPRIRYIEANESDESASLLDHQDLNTDLYACQRSKKSFLQSCTLKRSLALDRVLFTSVYGFEFPNDRLQTKRRRVCDDVNIDTLEVDTGNQGFSISPRIMQQEELPWGPRFPKQITGDDLFTVSRDYFHRSVTTNFDLFSRVPLKSFSSRGKPFAEERGLADPVVHMESSSSGDCSLSSEWCSLTSDALFQAPAGHIEHFSDGSPYHGSGLGKRTNYHHFGDGKNRCDFNSDIMSRSSCQANHILSGTEGYADSTKDAWKFLHGHDLCDELSARHPDEFVGERDWLPADTREAHKSIAKCKRREHLLRNHDQELEERSRRSHSAPPFYRQKTRFVSLNHYSMTEQGQSNFVQFHDSVANDLKHLYSQPSDTEDLVFSTRSNVKHGTDIAPNMSKVVKDRNIEHSQRPQGIGFPVKGFMPKETPDPIDCGAKWRNGNVAKHKTSNIETEHNILDISSGFLHLAGNLFVPELLHKNFLEGVKVLQQVDKKFIPVVGGGTLAVIDQHAADERIRLEELRQKVLSGEARAVTYLAAEQELNLPEIGFQLLHNYAEQVREWGWICNIQAQGSGTFKKNLNALHQLPATVTLLAVPRILGVNLSEGDLLQFLEQLAETDGSSTLPPSVLRVLNSKACRGAIMFGDSLLPSECSLIVEELKQTSLCFQCAHGRPTTAPLVNLEALHQQIAKLGLSRDASTKAWHGLRRHEMSVERAAARLSAAQSGH